MAEVALPTIGAEVASKLSEDQAEIGELTERSKHFELELKLGEKALQLYNIIYNVLYNINI